VGAAVEWTGPERLHGLLELLGHLRDSGLGDPLDPELTDQPFDTPGGHAAHVALCDDLDEGSLGTPAGLEEPFEEGGAFTQLRDGQRDRAGAGVPRPFPVAVASVGPLGWTLPVVSAAERVGIGAHQLLGEDLHHLPQQVDVGSFELLAEVLQGVNLFLTTVLLLFEFTQFSLRTRWSSRPRPSGRSYTTSADAIQRHRVSTPRSARAQPSNAVEIPCQIRSPAPETWGSEQANGG
jgi:hypothetical protein